MREAKRLEIRELIKNKFIIKTKEVQKLIGKDLSKKLKEKGVKKSFITDTKKICSSPTLLSLLNGNIAELHLYRLIEIYKAIGETEINIKSDNLCLNVKF